MITNGFTIEPFAFLESANLTDANLTGADLTGADLTGAVICEGWVLVRE